MAGLVVTAPNPAFWAGKRVFLTGHTGFKGSWLALWLADLGAEVHGFALVPPTVPGLFDVAQVERRLARSTIGDVRDPAALTAAMRRADPDVVFHLAAQPLVRASYADPVGTFGTNVMGTVNVAEAARECAGVRGLVVVTTDKCYENVEWQWAYREIDAMGGHDPYSSSKGCAELVAAAYRRSFFAERGIGLATARAGNVIGGGDWATDRLVPDALKAFAANETLVVRAPHAVRPWQHVLEPLAGYLQLAERLVADPSRFAEAWNFGPADSDARPVDWIVRSLAAAWGGAAHWHVTPDAQLHEAGHLKLDISKTQHRLGWTPRWNLRTALGHIVEWHREWLAGNDMSVVCLAQIGTFTHADKDEV